ncbi:MAG: alcohol dehydrogenase catalytic domain-containing protein [Clostridia bacterium]|nr:alcohol dehydrogenase catalytic domain-containing protein [Clostridia bacterium]
MKAAVWTGVDKIEIQDIPIPEIGEEQALIKVKAAGVCATDYHIISGKLKIGDPPNVQGHEICGVVEKINTTRDDIKVGMRCVIATSIGCGHCAHCRAGNQYLCAESAEIGYNPHHGGYAEYVKVPVSAIVPIPDSVSDSAGSILESIVCPTESLMRLGVPLAGSVFITGAGPAALAFIMIAKLMGAGKIISLVRGEYKAALVKRFGADETIDATASEDFCAEVLAMTGGEGADVVIEATGAGGIIEKMPYCSKKGGKVILYGIPGDDEVVNFPIKKLITEEIAIYGAVGNTKAWYPLVDLIAKKQLDLEKMVTHRFKLEEIDKAFDLYRNREKGLIKAIIEF